MGVSFKWNPASFEDAVRIATSATGVILNTMVNILRQMGSLSCPAPEWDPQGIYRVGLEGNKPTIQKRQPDGSWGAAVLHPPSIPSENARLKDQKFHILDAPSLLNSDLQSSGGPLGIALIYLDVDGFKQVNTRFTETVVDQYVLPILQKQLADWTGSLGHVYAEGGDEIVILLTNCTSAMAAAFAEEIRQRVAALQFSIEQEQVRLTISIGIATTQNAKEDTSLKRRANEAKNRAKQTGKNKVMTHGEDAPLTTSGTSPTTTVVPVSLETCLLAELDYPVVYRSKKLLKCRIRIRTVQQLPSTVRVHAWRVINVLIDGEKTPSTERFNDAVITISQPGLTNLGRDLEFLLTPEQAQREQLAISAQLQLEIIGAEPPPLLLHLEERYCRMTP